MDFLKYLDVVIGLAVVMVMMSPLVTAITQIILVISRRRSGLLRDGLAFLLQQIDGDPLGGFDRMEIRAEPNQTVTIESLGTFTTDANGVWRGAFAPAKADSSKRLAVTVTTGGNAANPPVRLRLIPKASGSDQSVTGTVAGGQGQATIDYAFDGPAGFASTTAAVTVKDAAAVAVNGANVTWKIVGGPQDGMTGDASTG